MEKCSEWMSISHWGMFRVLTPEYFYKKFIAGIPYKAREVKFANGITLHKIEIEEIV